MENIEDEEVLLRHRFYMEIVALATFLGLIFPLIFLWLNRNNIPQADVLVIPTGILVALLFLLYILSTGTIFPWLSPKWIEIILYIWGIALLSLVAVLVHYTGGIQSSILTWLFGYAFIVTIIVRPTHEQTFFKQWRPVLFTVGFEILFIAILVRYGRYSIRIPNTIQESMSIWGGTSVGSSLSLSFFLFYVSTKGLEKLKKKLEELKQRVKNV